MSITDETLLALTDRNEFLEAAHPILYAALDRMRYLASPDRLKVDDVDEVLAKIREVAKTATTAINNCVQAEFQRGLELQDEDALDQMNAYGYPAMSNEGKLHVISALKRNARDERKPQSPPTEWMGIDRTLTLHTNKDA